MRWMVLFLTLLSTLIFGCILSVETKDSVDSITVDVILSSPSRLEKKEGLAGTVHLIKLLDCYEVRDFSSIPVRSGPLDFVSIFSLSGRTYISFQTIAPAKPTITVSGKKIRVRFEKSPRRYDYSFNDSMELGDVIKYFSETLGVNVSVSSGVLHKKLPSMNLENTTPEDAFRTILISLGLVYAYFPNGVMYISDSLEDLRRKLLEVWGVSSEESLMNAVRAGVLKTLRDGAIIFTMAPSENLRGIIGEAMGEYYDMFDVEDKDAAKSVLNEIFGDRLKIITTLPGSAVMVYGKKKDIEEALKVLRRTRILVGESVERGENKFYRVMEVTDPDAARGLVEGIYPSIKVVPVDGKVVIYGTEDDIRRAEDLLRNVGFLELTPKSSEEASPSAKPISYEIMEVEDPEEVAKYLEGILEGLKVVVGKGKVAVVGGEDQVEEARKLVKRLEEKEEEIIDVWSVPDPEGVSKVLGEIFEGLKIVPGKGEVIVKGYRNLVEKAKDLLMRMKVFEEKKGLEVLEVGNPEEVSQILSELFPDLKVIPLKGKVLMSGDEADVKAALEMAKKISKSSRILWKVMDFGKLSDKQMEVLNKLGSYFGVEIVAIPSSEKLILIGEDEKGFKRMEEMIDEISRGTTRIPVVVEDGKISIDVEDMPAVELVKTVLRELGEGVVVLEDVSTPVRMSVSGLSLDEFLEIMKDFGVDVRKRDGIYFIKSLSVERSPESTPAATQVEIPRPTPSSTSVSRVERTTVRVSKGLISVRCDGCDLSRVIEDLSEEMNINVVFIDRPDFPVTMNMKDVGLEEFLDVVRNFGFTLIEKDGIYYVKRLKEEGITSATSTVNFEAKFKDGKAYVFAENIPLATIVKELAKGLGVNIVMIDTPSESVSVKADGMTFDDLKELLDKFGYTFEEVDGINYLIRKGRTIVGKIVYGFEKLQSLVQSLGGQMFYDSTTGMVIARDLSSGAYDLVKKYMENLKHTPPQVSIEVKIIEEIGNENQSFSGSVSVSSNGLGFSDGNLGITTDVISSASYEEILKGLLGGNVKMTLSGGKGTSRSNLIASPNITVVSGETANIQIGRTTYTTIAGTPMTFTSGVILQITPFVRPDGRIDMNVSINLNDDLTSSDNTGTSQFRRSAQTRVVLDDGQTLVIGGLMREMKVKNVQKLPVLGDLPIIGWLFRSEKESRQVSNLTIFITARVVKK